MSVITERKEIFHYNKNTKKMKFIRKCFQKESLVEGESFGVKSVRVERNESQRMVLCRDSVR